MTIYPSIKNEQEYEAALEAIERLIEAEPGTPEGEKFEALANPIIRVQGAKPEIFCGSESALSTESVTSIRF